MKFVAAIAVVLAAAGGLSQVSSQPKTGTVVVLPISGELPNIGSPGCFYNPKTLKLSIDKRDTIPWPHKEQVRISDLALDQKHLVVITSDGKRLQSFWFKFSNFNESTLCLAYDAYGCAQLADRTTELWCRAK